MPGAGPARATPYQISYEADTPGSFPEDEGWERFTTGGGVSRTVENGILTLEAVNPPPDGGSDQYTYDMQEQLNPDPGEYFFAEWRMRLLPGSGSSDVQVFIVTDGMDRAFSGMYATSAFASSRDGQIAYLDTTLFHTYRLVSSDMVDYEMFIDDQLAWEGFFGLGTTQSSLVRFGDALVASASGSEWDFVRFGVVVPESPTIPLFAIGLSLTAGGRRMKNAASNEYHTKPERIRRCVFYSYVSLWGFFLRAFMRTA